MAKHLVVILLELDAGLLKECGLPEKAFEELPAQLAKELRKIAPKAITPCGAYFLSDKKRAQIEQVLEGHAMDFTEVMLTYHEDGKKKKAPITCTVIKLETYRRKQLEGAVPG